MVGQGGPGASAVSGAEGVVSVFVVMGPTMRAPGDNPLSVISGFFGDFDEVELVALRVGEGGPPVAGLVEVAVPPGAQGGGALDTGGEVGDPEVDMHAVLGRLRFGHLHERPHRRAGDAGEVVGGALVEGPIEQGRPEAGDLHRFGAVEGQGGKRGDHGVVSSGCGWAWGSTGQQTSVRSSK